MTPEAQRIAIAEFCGWSIEPAPKPAPDWPDSMWNVYHNGKRVDTFGWWDEKLKQVPSIPTLANCVQSLPDYLNDLNAMHEAEQGLTDKQRKNFVNQLWVKVNPDLATKWDEAGTLAFFDYICATAAQRAEALLRTIGRWEEDAVMPSLPGKI